MKGSHHFSVFSSYSFIVVMNYQSMIVSAIGSINVLKISFKTRYDLLKRLLIQR